MADQQDPSLSSEVDEFAYKPGIDSKSDVRNALLVVATLIVAVTFQAGLNPPGGFWQENSPTSTQDNSSTPTHEAGKAILGSNKAAFTIFIFSNTTAFSASSTVIAYLVQGFPFQLMVRISLFFMCFTYGASITALQPDQGALSIAALYIALFLPYILTMASHMWLKIKASCAKGWSRIS
ncbi:putative PGG domain-containing protein [Fagus crenata]